MGGIHVMHSDFNWREESALHQAPLFTLSRGDLGDRPAVHMDVRPSSSSFPLLVINDRGALYGSNWVGDGLSDSSVGHAIFSELFTLGSPSGALLFTFPEASSTDNFFRVRHSHNFDECLAASASSVVRIDMRVRRFDGQFDTWSLLPVIGLLHFGYNLHYVFDSVNPVCHRV
jgi:hypothetical protein